ncbi:MAG: hypothetical protein JEZ06_22120 [Anaerolineaceae bacterium]|nr:hypothetical protein [Anaerolineaceae bacterium]
MKFKIGILILVFMLIFSGCNAATPKTDVSTESENTSEESVNIDAIKTEVAATVIAQVTVEYALTKASEPQEEAKAVDPTNTVLPATAIMTETTAPTIIVPTSTKTNPPPAPVSGNPQPTSTSYIDKASLESQSPADDIVFNPGESFDLVFTIKNIGGRNWNGSEYLSFTGGVAGESHDHTQITVVNAPSATNVRDSVSFVIDMKAPNESGYYKSSWALVSQDGVAFFWPHLSFAVSP